MPFSEIASLSLFVFSCEHKKTITAHFDAKLKNLGVSYVIIRDVDDDYNRLKAAIDSGIHSVDEFNDSEAARSKFFEKIEMLNLSIHR